VWKIIYGMMPSFRPGDNLPEGISQIVSSVFPKSRVQSLRILEGGKTNTNVLVQIENYDDLFVLRYHLRGREVCRKEVSLLQALRDVLPVPELINADITGDKSGTTYLLYRYVRGQTFREIRDGGSSRDMADAACAIGRSMSVLENFQASSLGHSGLLQRFEIHKGDFDSPVLRERLGVDDWLLLHRLHAEWSPVLQNLSNDGSLIHGDFNHRNIVLRNPRGTWEVAGVLDWELASTGSFLWDAARFMCYERPDSKWWEHDFVEGLRANSASIPDNWSDLSLTLNTLSAARSLANRSIPKQFIQELTMLVRSGLRGKRIG
jgi:aminoglycoside phosphotransferase (APT) family kinase protein